MNFRNAIDSGHRLNRMGCNSEWIYQVHGDVVLVGEVECCQAGKQRVLAQGDKSIVVTGSVKWP